MSDVKRTVLWSAETVQPNNTSITLNDSIDNYDEIIYYGSGTRTYCPCVMTDYPVISGQLNLGGPFFFGNWRATDDFVLCNGTQVFLSGTSGFVASSYYWGKNAGSTAYAASLVNNRTNDVRPYMIVGVKYPDNYDRTLIWSSEHTAQLYETNIQLSEPVTHFKEIAVLGSGFENGGVGCRHASKNVYNTQPRIMGCDAWAYTPWKLAEKHNLVIGQEMRLSGNSGHIGSGYYLGMGNQTTAYAAGKWNTDYQFSATAPYAIFGVDRKQVRNLTLLPTIGGTQSASETSGYEYDQITLSNTPDEGWYFSGYNVTGATLNGNIITLQDQDASAQAGFTDAGFPVTYQNDGHGTLTGDTNIGIPEQPINLTANYNTYYRLSGYDVTGGYVQDGKLYATAACTAKAVYKVNAFTATGRWFNMTTNSTGGIPYYAVSLCTYKTDNTPSNFLVKATAGSRTTNSGWQGGTCSGYKLSTNSISRPYKRGSGTTGGAGMRLYVGGTTLFSQNFGGGYRWEGNITAAAKTTTTTGLLKYEIVNTISYQYGKINDNNTAFNWTATGIAP